jgi:hypothetical protein
VEVATLYDVPGAQGTSVGAADAGTRVQVKGLSWEQPTDTWWYYVESTVGEGWVPDDRLGQ